MIIEDDADVRNLLKTVLTQSGFQTVLTSNGEDGIEAVRTHDPVLTTLDVSMPGMDGFAVAKRIREFSTTYVVMLTALADEIDVVQGLDSGADDYLLKPFRPRELRARIETMLRRPREREGISAGGVPPLETATSEAAPTQPAPAQAVAAPSPPAAPAAYAAPHGDTAAVPTQMPEAPAPDEVGPPVAPAMAPAYAHAFSQAQPAHQRPLRQPVRAPASVAEPSVDGWLEHRGLQLNTETRLTQVDGHNIDLTRTEFDLLATLLGSGRRVRSKADLVLALRGESYVTTYYVNDADKRAVEVHVANLRRKIGDSTATPRFIETVRGVGYRLASDREVG